MRLTSTFNYLKILVLSFLLFTSVSHAADDDAWANSIKAQAPAGIEIIKIKKRDYGLLVSGNSDSNARIASFMRNIHDKKLGTPLLDLIQTKDGVRFFVMRIKK